MKKKIEEKNCGGSDMPKKYIKVKMFTINLTLIFNLSVNTYFCSSVKFFGFKLKKQKIDKYLTNS